jgi:hypothetical protein
MIFDVNHMRAEMIGLLKDRVARFFQGHVIIIGQRIDADDIKSLCQQEPAQVKSDETRRTGNDDLTQCAPFPRLFCVFP